jgi:hypothetical protein
MSGNQYVFSIIADAKKSQMPGPGPVLKETLIRIMEISGTGAPEERVAVLERKLQEMEPLVKGLVAELLDLKAVTNTMNRQSDNRSRQEFVRGPIVQATAAPAETHPADDRTVVMSRARQPETPAVPAAPRMARIMQPDGTMKMELRYGESDMINSSSAYGRNRKGTAAESKQEPLIYAECDEKADPAKK